MLRRILLATALVLGSVAVISGNADATIDTGRGGELPAGADPPDPWGGPIRPNVTSIPDDVAQVTHGTVWPVWDMARALLVYRGLRYVEPFFFEPVCAYDTGQSDH